MAGKHLKSALTLFYRLHQRALRGRTTAAGRLAIQDGQICAIVLWDAVYLLYYWASDPPRPFLSSGLSEDLSEGDPCWTFPFSPDPLRAFPLDSPVQARCDGRRIVLSVDLSSSWRARPSPRRAQAEIALEPLEERVEAFCAPKGPKRDLAYIDRSSAQWAEKGLKMIDPDEPEVAPLSLLPSLPPVTRRPALVAMSSAHAYVQAIEDATVVEPVSLPPSMVEALKHFDPQEAVISSYLSGPMVLSSPRMLLAVPFEGRKGRAQNLEDIFHRAYASVRARAELPPCDLLDHLHPHKQALSRDKDNAAIHIIFSDLGVESTSPHFFPSPRPSVCSFMTPRHQEGSADIWLLRPMLHRLYTFAQWAGQANCAHMEIAVVQMSENREDRAILASCPPMWLIAMGAIDPYRNPGKAPYP